MVGIKPPSLQLPIPYSPFVVPERKGLFPEGYKFSITLSNHACIIFETKQLSLVSCFHMRNQSLLLYL